jgi:hypothetical protein
MDDLVRIERAILARKLRIQRLKRELRLLLSMREKRAGRGEV